MTRGDFYELHYAVDSDFYGTRFPRSVGGSWSGDALGLDKFGPVDSLWYGSPEALREFLAFSLSFTSEQQGSGGKCCKNP